RAFGSLVLSEERSGCCYKFHFRDGQRSQADRLTSWCKARHTAHRVSVRSIGAVAVEPRAMAFRRGASASRVLAAIAPLTQYATLVHRREPTCPAAEPGVGEIQCLGPFDMRVDRTPSCRRRACLAGYRCPYRKLKTATDRPRIG